MEGREVEKGLKGVSVLCGREGKEVGWPDAFLCLRRVTTP